MNTHPLFRLLRYVLFVSVFLVCGALGCSDETDQRLEGKRALLEQLEAQGDITTAQKRQLETSLNLKATQPNKQAPKQITSWHGNFKTIHILFGVVVIVLVISLIGLMRQYFTVQRVKWLSYLFFLLALGIAEFGVSTTFAAYWAFAGCFSLSIAVGITVTHYEGLGTFFRLSYKQYSLDAPITFAILCAVWSACAIYFQSQMCGFVAVFCAFVALGLVVSVDDVFGILGVLFPFGSAFERIVILAFGFIGLYAVMHFYGSEYVWLSYFRVGALAQGAVIGYVGLLVISSLWYSYEHDSLYFLMQIITPLLCIASIGLGELDGFSIVRQCGGTTLALFFLVKLVDIPKDSARVLFSVLATASLMILFFLYQIIKYPEIYGPYLFLV